MKIKVLHIINTMDLGGAESLLASQTNYFNKKKFEIHIGYLFGEGKQLNNVNNNTIVKDFSNNGVFTFASIYKVFKYIKEQKFDIVHSHLIHASLISRFLCFLFPKTIHITTRHYASESKHKRLVNLLERKTQKYSKKVICVSDFVQRWVIKYGLPERKTYVIYNGVLLDKFKPSNVAPKPFTIGFVGRFVKQKGIEVLIDSIKIVKKRIPEINLELIGYGELEPKLKQMVKKLNLEENIEFLGQIEAHKVPSYIDRWNFFVGPSRWEAFGIVFIEAMAMKKAVVASRVEAIPDVVTEGETGLLFEKENSKELAEKICYLLENSDICKKMGEAGRKKVEELFDISYLTKKLEDLYISLL